MRLGFVGAGAISRAVVVGLLDDEPDDIAVTLSPRGAAVAALLAERYPGRVAVAASNQAVLDATDVVVIAVVPGIVRKVLSELRFRPDHLVVSLVATVSADTIASIVAPATRVVRAIPLPSAADRASPTPVMPPDPVVKDIFDRTGVAIETTDAKAFDAMSAASGIMAGHFAAAGSVANWLAEQGLGRSQADSYVRLLLAGLAGTARSATGDFGELAKEHVTAGGLNEQFLAHLARHGVDATIRSGLDDLLARITRSASPLA
ncbi:NAD(P)-binding domain-containing protein [Aureimonas leprariae]|uniref:NADP oxidoreductase n=1 Tax=Plantimonas leprariae TaxID=2615207 RepID=A0A7V7TWV0_9HYPH|nr:NAD(P)-binding domain-containing protein [Aureimonas leprariae]KAB0680413.1 NADP oxidoreductase [Aureimonas leprariae]